jgi:hypothetical protein
MPLMEPGVYTTIPLAEYLELKEAARKLQCLEDAGVDNWESYHYAMEVFYGGEND